MGPLSTEYITITTRERKQKSMWWGGVSVLVLLALGSYFFYQTKDWILVPRLTVTAPTDGETIYDTRVHVSGTVGAGLELSINGREASQNGEGAFQEEILLPPGTHLIQVEARDRFGKANTVTRRIVVHAAKEEHTTN